MKYRVIAPLLILIFIFPSLGFVCATRVEKMEADIGALQMQFTEIQQRINNDQTQLTEMILRADKKLDELGALQDQTHDKVAQSNVDLGIQLEKERASLAELRGQMEVQQKNLTELQSTMQSVMGSLSSSTGGQTLALPADRESLYNFIIEKRNLGDKNAERTAATEFLSRYPDEPRLEDVLGPLPALYAENNMDREAITYATRYLQLFPKGSKKNDVIAVMGESGLKINNCELAVRSYEALAASKYPNASRRLNEIKAACKK
ncbi:MAG: hypothetical protein WC966_11845 [Bradymonadales bacterium]